MSGPRPNGAGLALTNRERQRLERERAEVQMRAQEEGAFRAAVLDTASRVAPAIVQHAIACNMNMGTLPDHALDDVADVAVSLARRLAIRAFAEPLPSEQELQGPTTAE